MWKKLVCVIIFCSICGYICRSYDCSSFLLLETWLMMIRKSLHKVSINITWCTGSLRHILGNIAWWPWCSIFSSPGLGHVSYCHHFSSFVRPSTFHILIFSSETTEPISTKLCWNDPWVAPFQNCVRWSRLPTKMATKLKIEKRGWNLKEIFSSETTEPISTKLCWNDPWVVPFQNCVCHFRIQTSYQDGCHSQT